MRSRETTYVAVVGAGSIGARHLEVLSTMGAVQLVAVPKRPERISQLQKAGYSTKIMYLSGSGCGTVD